MFFKLWLAYLGVKNAIHDKLYPHRSPDFSGYACPTPGCGGKVVRMGSAFYKDEWRIEDHYFCDGQCEHEFTDREITDLFFSSPTDIIKYLTNTYGWSL